MPININPEISLLPVAASGTRTSLKESTAQLKYRVLNTDSLDLASVLLMTNRPLSHDGLPYLSHSYEEKGFGIWEFTVNYGIDDSDDGSGDENSMSEEDVVISFNTGGGTARITRSLQTMQKAAKPGGVAPDFQGGIGWDGERFEGTDITEPGWEWTETHYRNLDFVNRSYRRLLRSMTGTVNSRPFRDMDAGEVLFLGCQAQNRRNSENVMIWELRYSFTAKPNRNGLVIGDLEPVNKAGWDLLWTLPELRDDEESQKTVSVPMAVYVERVYERANFANLGIGE
jgi:hypothetical protein